VEDHNHGRSTLLVECSEQIEQLNLVGQVEVGSGLIEQQDVGFLGERHGNPVTAGELGDLAFR
jgi:hypothetical protein